MTRPPLDLEAIRQRVESSTPGPWLAVEGALGDPANGPDHIRVLQAPHVDAHSALLRMDGHDQQGSDDATFIAHAREDVPALLAEVERLRDGTDLFMRVPYDHTPDCVAEKKYYSDFWHPDCGACWQEKLRDVVGDPR